MIFLQGFEPMSLATIPIIEDPCRSEHQEQKISSSSCREQLLGTLIRKPEVGKKCKIRLMSLVIWIYYKLCSTIIHLGLFQIWCDAIDVFIWCVTHVLDPYLDQSI